MVHKPYIAVLFVSSFLSLGMSVFRTLYTGDFAFAYMGVNLLLAWLPFLFSLSIHTLVKRKPAVVLFVLWLLWVLFYPNTLYLVTDFVHLTPRPLIPLWFDALMLSVFALTGLALGFSSLYIMERVMKKYTSGYLFSASILALGSFGVYVGRFLRWNSWDMIIHPWAVLSDIATSLYQPTTIAFTVAVSLSSITLYFLLRSTLRSAITQ